MKNAFENARSQGVIDFYNDTNQDTAYISLNNKLLREYTVKDFRNILTSETKPCATGFWLKKLNVQLTSKHWSSVFTSTKETQLKVLQWKILHNIYPTNILLTKMKLRNTETCSACSSGDKDYIEHFFYDCSEINLVWKLVESAVKEFVDRNITINQSTALLGYQDTNTPKLESQIINHLILIAKMCISKFRYGVRSKINLIWERELLLRKHIIK